jgi:hypothetical protein
VSASIGMTRPQIHLPAAFLPYQHNNTKKERYQVSR